MKKKNVVVSRKQLAKEYGVSIRTLHRWIKQEGINVPPGLIKPNKLKEIYEAFGNPNEVNY